MIDNLQNAEMLITIMESSSYCPIINAYFQIGTKKIEILRKMHYGMYGRDSILLWITPFGECDIRFFVNSFQVLEFYKFSDGVEKIYFFNTSLEDFKIRWKGRKCMRELIIRPQTVESLTREEYLIGKKIM